MFKTTSKSNGIFFYLKNYTFVLPTHRVQMLTSFTSILQFCDYLSSRIYVYFQGPKPPIPWEGIYDAIITTKCPQKGEGNEDCLHLNVFTPITIPGTPLPVLVYIHGGSFIMGTAPTAGVEHLIKQNIIVVTINYRLGALGFLCLGLPEAPGNAGLKDQVAALKYVQENIGHFGGDPKRVTVYGMSAGGASVEYLILSKTSTNLFHQAIIESASATSPWALDRKPVATAQKVAELLDIPNTDFRQILVEHYKKVPSVALAEANFAYYNNLTDGTFGFVPCVESKNISGQEPFMTKPPSEILAKGDFRKMPTMFFFATLEGLYLRSAEYHEHHYKKRMESNFLDFLPADLDFHSNEVKKETARIIKRFYFSNGIDKISYLNYFGDSLIMHGLLNSVEAHGRSFINLVYLMEFGYKGNLGGYEEFYEPINVAGHGDVVKYAILNKQPVSESDKLTVRRVTRLIANYVKYG